MTVRELCEWAEDNDCLDREICIYVINEFGTSTGDPGFTEENLEKGEGVIAGDYMFINLKDYEVCNEIDPWGEIEDEYE